MNKRDRLINLLIKCSDDQILLFNRMYGSVHTMEESKIKWALIQVETTLKKNEEDYLRKIFDLK